MSMRWCAACAVLWLALAPTAARAQTNASVEIDALARDLAAQAKTAGTRISVVNNDNLPRTIRIAGQIVASPLVSLADVEESRVDEQLGSTSSTSGSTNLVSKGGIPAIFALAVENGALTQSVSGTTFTFRGTPAGIVDALRNKGFADLLPAERTPWTRRVSFSASFDASRGNPDGGALFTGDRQQLSQWTARYEIVNRRDLGDPRYRVLFEQNLASNAADLAAAELSVAQTFTRDQALKEWAARLDESVVAGGTDVDAIRAALRRGFEQFPRERIGDTTRGTLTSAGGVFTRLVDTRAAILNRIAQGLIVTLEYANDRPATGPDLSALKFIAAQGGPMELTANASIAFYHDEPALGVGKVKHFEASGQVDLPLSRGSAFGNYVISVAARVAREQHDPATPPDLLATAGGATIATGQIKLTIPIPNNGIRIPLSISFANRTELIREKIVRANVGITYDFDALFARLRPE
jgi:hypothetical protein